jgi:molybdopterin-guanine dinucleotide biosynthesis protein A
VAAIRDALARHGGHVVVAACDLPDIDGATIAAIVAAGQERGRVAVAHAAGFDHLLGYWPAGVAEALEPLPDSYRSALDHLDAVRVDVDPELLRNVNSPDDV